MKNVFIIERIDSLSYCEDYKAVVVADDVKQAEEFARKNIEDFKNATLKIDTVDLNTTQIITVENTES